MIEPLSTSEIVFRIRKTYQLYLDKTTKSKENLFFDYPSKPTILVSFTNLCVENCNYYSTDKYDIIMINSFDQSIEIIKELGLFKNNTEKILCNQYNLLNGNINNLYLKVSYFIPINF